MDKLDFLKEYFGHDSFREGQEELIDAILSGRDVLGVMPTGAGKSMCYQIPALMMSGVTFVVSPLISLMKDQVNALNQSGINAAFLNSSLSLQEYNATFSAAFRGEYKIIYVAPERLCTPGFLELAANVRISLLAVDEAHCVSQWGQDFRPSYLKIPEFVSQLEHRPIIAAFTATATAEVKENIIEMLKLQSPYSITTGFDRKNLYFEVQKPTDRFGELVKIVNRNEGKSGIIYCSTRKNVEDICERLTLKGFPCVRYHAGLSDEERRANQDDFIYDRVRLIAATNAFGMGINKSNVSFVVHYNMPKNIESYYQEAGRAGRDGEPAECILLYSGQDVHTNRFLINNNSDNSELDEDQLVRVRECDLERLRQMTFYCTTTDCLRRFILNYFGESAKACCDNCSNCNTGFKETDVTIESQKILSCIYRLAQRKLSFGAAVVTAVLKGSKNEKIEKFHLETLSTYKIMEDTTAERIRRIIEYLEECGYIRRQGDFPTLVLNPKAAEVLSGGNKVIMKLPDERKSELKKFISKQSSAELSDSDQQLMKLLRSLRTRLAAEANMPAYIIFTDAALRDMCIKKPRTAAQLLNCSGIGHVKQERYGKQILEVIEEYMSMRNS